MTRTVMFKSTPENYQKEFSGAKPNTIRRDLPSESRLQGLKAGDRICIQNTKSLMSFERPITDVTRWEGWVIISWRHE